MLILFDPRLDRGTKYRIYHIIIDEFAFFLFTSNLLDESSVYLLF
jgi:hypothetical protein